MKEYSFIEAERILLRNGFTFKRGRGSHMMYDRNGSLAILPRSTKRIKKGLFSRIIKDNDIDISL